MSEMLYGKHAGFILGAYGATFVVLVALILWVVVTARQRRRQLDRFEKLADKSSGQND